MKIAALLSRRAGLVLLGIVLLAAFVFVVARTGPFAPTRVTVVKVAEGSVAPELFGIGTVEARRAYLIGPTASGRVLRVAVDVGEAVKAGQLLAEMDPVDLDQRVGAVDASIARAASATAAPRPPRRTWRRRGRMRRACAPSARGCASSGRTCASSRPPMAW